MPTALTDLLESDGFRVGLAVALAAAVVVALVALVRPAWAPAGVAATVGVLAGFAAEDRWSRALVVALVVLAIGAECTARLPFALRPLGLVPGALLLAAALPDPVPDWGALVAVLGTVGAGFLVTGSDTLAPRLTVPLFVLTALGIYAAVPDTEYARALAGGMAGAAALGLVPGLRPRPGLAAALTALCVWSAVTGGYPRPASVAGALGCFGVLVLLPLAPRAAPRWTSTLPRVAALAAVNVVVVGVASRGAGLRQSTALAVGIVVATLAAAWLVLVAPGPVSPRPGPGRSRPSGSREG